jgi:hypothetical protein
LAWSSTRLQVLCCDIEPAAIARSLVLLQLLAELPSGGVQLSVGDAILLWEIVYNTFITDAVANQLHRLLRRLSEQLEDLDAWNRGPLAALGIQLTGDIDAVKKLVSWWASNIADATFRSDEMAKRAQRVRKLFRKMCAAERKINSLEIKLAYLGKMKAKKEAEFYLLNGYQSIGVLCDEDGSGLAESLSPSSGRLRTVLNPTFLPDIINLVEAFDKTLPSQIGKVWRVHYGAHPIQCLETELLAALGDLPPSTTMRFLRSKRTKHLSVFESCWEMFGRRMDALASSLRLGIHRVVLHCGDAFALCDVLRSEPLSWLPSQICKMKALQARLRELEVPQQFDFIDTSNIGDNTTILPLLLAAVPLLAPVAENPRATLATDLMKVSGRNDKDITTSALEPLPLWMIPFSVGVQLDQMHSLEHRDSAAQRDPSSLWTVHAPSLHHWLQRTSTGAGRGGCKLRWRRCEGKTEPLRLADSEQLEEVMYECLEYAVNISPTPWGLPTFVRLLQSMAGLGSFTNLIHDIGNLFDAEILMKKFSPNILSYVPTYLQSFHSLLHLHGLFEHTIQGDVIGFLEIVLQGPDDWKSSLDSEISNCLLVELEIGIGQRIMRFPVQELSGSLVRVLVPQSAMAHPLQTFSLLLFASTNALPIYHRLKLVDVVSIPMELAMHLLKDDEVLSPSPLAEFTKREWLRDGAVRFIARLRPGEPVLILQKKKQIQIQFSPGSSGRIEIVSDSITFLSLSMPVEISLGDVCLRVSRSKALFDVVVPAVFCCPLDARAIRALPRCSFSKDPGSKLCERSIRDLLSCSGWLNESIRSRMLPNTGRRKTRTAMTEMKDSIALFYTFALENRDAQSSKFGVTIVGLQRGTSIDALLLLSPDIYRDDVYGPVIRAAVCVLEPNNVEDVAGECRHFATNYMNGLRAVDLAVDVDEFTLWSHHYLPATVALATVSRGLLKEPACVCGSEAKHGPSCREAVKFWIS